MTGAILALNAGSSSLKFALFASDETERLRGEIQGIGAAARISAQGADGKKLDPPALSGATHEDVLAPLLGWLRDHTDGETLAAVGHRIVHGGEVFADPVRIDDDVLAKLDGLIPLAPLHQPHSLAAIRAVARIDPAMVQIGCFDTAFHRTMPDVAKRLALPRPLTASGLRRYGFHGLSYDFIASRLRQIAPSLAEGRVIVAHLGSGASLCALRDGKSIETTMGFSVLDGLVMGTRPGDLDPGAVLYLLRERGMSAEAVEDMLYHKSGLLGVSGISADMRELSANPSPAPREAIELFVYRMAGEAGRLASALGGLDGFVFTGGIGAHDSAVRAQICARLAWLGARLDAAKTKGCISVPGTRPEIWVMPTDEEWVIARAVRDVMQAHS